MELTIDPDVKSVAEFMQSSLPAARLVSVAHAISSLAPILWGRYDAESVDALYLAHPQPSINGSAISPRAANEWALPTGAGDGLVAAKDVNEPKSR